MKRGIILAAVLTGLVGTGLIVKLAVDAKRPKGSDDRQIRMMLYDAERAAEQKSVSGIAKYISEDYRDGLDMNAPRLKYAIRDWMRLRNAVEVTIPTESIRVQIEPDGKAALVQFHLSLGTDLEGRGTATSDMEMGLRLRKEPVYYYYLFPGEEWRVVSSEGYSPEG